MAEGHDDSRSGAAEAGHAFKAIPHKDVEVVVFMTDTGEHKCKISENERKALK